METESDILVIGGGIAGLSAALCAARLGRRTHVLTGTALGGHLLSIELIDGYPGFAEGVPGYDLCPIVQGQAAEAGAEFAMAEATQIESKEGRWAVKSPSGDYDAAALIVATGTSLKTLNIPGESELAGHGVSHCASCDAPLLGGKPVVVAGGGDSAAQEALVLAKHASSVHIVFDGAELTAQQAYQDQISRDSQIVLVPNSRIVEIFGEDAVSAVQVENSDGAAERLPVEGVFVFVGLAPNASVLNDLVATDSTGYIVTDNRYATNLAGVFAAGTVRAGSMVRAATAAGEGTAAALAADEWLNAN